MAEDYGETIITDTESVGTVEKEKNNKVWLIVIVVLVVICCCFAVGAYGVWWLWNNGDQLLDLASQFSYLL
jgi:hypothetical protein